MDSSIPWARAQYDDLDYETGCTVYTIKALMQETPEVKGPKGVLEGSTQLLEDEFRHCSGRLPLVAAASGGQQAQTDRRILNAATGLWRLWVGVGGSLATMGFLVFRRKCVEKAQDRHTTEQRAAERGA